MLFNELGLFLVLEDDELFESRQFLLAFFLLFGEFCDLVDLFIVEGCC